MNPRHRTINGTRVLVEPTGPNTLSVWASGQQPYPETFYGLARIGKYWMIRRYRESIPGVDLSGGAHIGNACSKQQAIQLAVLDWQGAQS